MAAAIELYLIRHGLAAERGPAWPDDTKRPLVRKGVARLREQADGLTALGVAFDIVLTSPLTRARQTADVIARGLAKTPPVKSMASLAPGSPYQDFRAELAQHAGHLRIALVGHEPDLGRLAVRLLGAKGTIEFKKGAVCRIDVSSLPPRAPGTLRWLATPRMLRHAGR